MTIIIVWSATDHPTPRRNARCRWSNSPIRRARSTAEAREELLETLATKLLEAEKAPDTDFFRSITWIYANEIEPETLAVGGRPGGEPRFRVQVTVPDGALSDRRKGILVDSFNRAVLDAAGLPESEGLRVWTIIREVTDGNWGAAGQAIRYKQLVELAAGEREGAAATA